MKCDSIFSLDDIKDMILGKNDWENPKYEIQIIWALVFGLTSQENSFWMTNLSFFKGV